MKLAYKEANKSDEPLKCGVVITKNGKVVAKAFNTQRKSKDASAHAELNAIRKAGKRLGDKNLWDCTIYCTCEPCIMCLSAIVYAKIPQLIYNESLAELSSEIPVNIPLKFFLKNSIFPIKVSKLRL